MKHLKHLNEQGELDFTKSQMTESELASAINDLLGEFLEIGPTPYSQNDAVEITSQSREACSFAILNYLQQNKLIKLA